jgi:hypothetical protein
MEDFMIAISRALLLALEKEDDKMTNLCARGFLTVNDYC